MVEVYGIGLPLPILIESKLVLVSNFYALISHIRAYLYLPAVTEKCSKNDPPKL